MHNCSLLNNILYTYSACIYLSIFVDDDAKHGEICILNYRVVLKDERETKKAIYRQNKGDGALSTSTTEERQ